ncbi:5-dehydro-4-deoxyglucarate dehydratase [Nocardiopsis sp. RSe5-2]|uniref:Probable 5-dehydro-4-deoxyglucarate dehydratase n=1 Tax=Nocardiopsis endophytica TaxID=3018445 RepID=A0ABT4UCI3_9ACTN|nr:5-dehydro-4-deoxyglucarate dehydratase [Nocardiopsis endophytica]MDA2814697.1 5-dehydro-4-deoxyglucarate dehydratase [Nocardiopsis endophytica]
MYTDAPAPPDTARAVSRTLAAAMDRGVLSFPLTPFRPDLSLDLDAFRDHLRGRLASGPGAVFVACGTGEYSALTEDEYAALVAAAVEEADGALPVVAGAGHGWAQAARYTAAAARAGADAVLLMPPYLVEGPEHGLVEYVRSTAASSPLPVIVYQRAQLRLTPSGVAELARVPQVIGLKDGHGDLDALQRIRLAAPPEWLFFNGVATAEMQARAYRAIGVPAYSSAVHAFAPEIAAAFFRAFQDGDEERVDALLRGFYLPLVELRDLGAGYAVSLVKAGARLRGQAVGPVRPPLADPAPDHMDRLEALLDTGLSLVGAA